MLLNAYSILDLFLISLRLLSGLLLCWLAAVCWWRGRRAMSPEKITALEDRSYLLSLLAVWLVALNLLSWPLFYWLLQSYVPEWPGVMCIYGVTQVGAGSMGSSRFLPALIEALQIIKPVLVFLGGAWFVLYLINRRTPTAPLRHRLLVMLTLLGLLGVLDAAVEGAYLIIPKKEEFLSVGCCTPGYDSPDRSGPQAWMGAEDRPKLSAAYFAINAAMVLGLALVTGLAPPSRKVLSLLLAGAVISLPISALFLVEIAAPALLHLPHHHCPYDLLPQVPESVLALALYGLGCFGVGWAFLVGWLGRPAETGPWSGPMIRQLLFLALVGYFASLVMMFVELKLA